MFRHNDSSSQKGGDKRSTSTNNRRTRDSLVPFLVVGGILSSFLFLIAVPSVSSESAVPSVPMNVKNNSSNKTFSSSTLNVTSASLPPIATASKELEAEWVKCKEDEWQCVIDGFCIPILWTCDKVTDCHDESDELDCEGLETEIKTVPKVVETKDERGIVKVVEWPGCHKSQYKCHNSNITTVFCIKRNHLCDGYADCEDKSDEGGLCSSCQHFGCEGDCSPHPYSEPKCSCDSGFILNDDGKTCRDVDECVDHSPCSQICINVRSSYRCECLEGYRLETDMKTCSLMNADGATVYVAHGTSIVGVLLNETGSGKITVPRTVHETHESFRGVAGIDYSSASGLLYMAFRPSPALSQLGCIYTLDLQGKVERCLVTNVEGLDNVGVDWVTGNIYYSSFDVSHPKNMAFGVCTPDGRYCAKLDQIPQQKIRRPRGMIIHPRRGVLIWSRYDDGKGQIEMAGLDGIGGETLVDGHLLWPSAITMDYTNEKLYYADAVVHLIETYDLKHKKRDILLDRHSVQHPRDMLYFDNKLFWSDLRGKGLVVYAPDHLSQKSHSSSDVRLLSIDQKIPHGIAIDHQLHQRKDLQNPCLNANCSHICALRPQSWSSKMMDDDANTTFTCLCPTGYYHDHNTPGRCLYDRSSININTLTGLCRKEFREMCQKGTACFNGGKCVRGATECTCRPGFSGRFCEILGGTKGFLGGDNAANHRRNWHAVIAILIILLVAMCLLIAYYSRKWAYPFMEKRGPLFPNAPSVSFLRRGSHFQRQKNYDETEHIVNKTEDGFPPPTTDHISVQKSAPPPQKDDSFANPMYVTASDFSLVIGGRERWEDDGPLINLRGGDQKSLDGSDGIDDSGVATKEEALDEIAF